MVAVSFRNTYLLDGTDTSQDFGFETTFADLQAKDSCTSCEVTQDHSAYWTPTMHFMYNNGTTVMVPNVGGMLAYYLYYLDNVQAFPKGFQMLAGNKNLRNFTGPFPDDPLSSWPTDPTDQFFLEQRAIGWNCLNYQILPPEPSLYRHNMPTKEYMDAHCADGIRLELAFPSCGKSGVLDSEDHKSHVAYPSLVKEGNCPEGFDVNYPFLFYETIWATNVFAGEDGQFVMSYGDPDGSGYHGDFIMGWESEKFLQSALDTCKSPSGLISDCPLFTTQKDSEAAQCTFEMPDSLKDDDVQGPREGLPVDVPVQYGPLNATAYPCAGRSGTPTTNLSPSSAPSSYSHEAVSYSPANPSLTATAPGGIVVAKYSSGAPTEASATASSEYSSAPVAAITASPSLSDASVNDDIVATSYMTQGNEVVELFIEEVDVTVTATASPSAAKYRRHLHKHQHHQGARRS